jgi:hypothetical protein
MELDNRCPLCLTSLTAYSRFIQVVMWPEFPLLTLSNNCIFIHFVSPSIHKQYLAVMNAKYENICRSPWFQFFAGNFAWLLELVVHDCNYSTQEVEVLWRRFLTQGPALDRQVLYYLSHIPGPLFYLLIDSTHPNRSEVVFHCGFDLQSADYYWCWAAFYGHIGHLCILWTMSFQLLGSFFSLALKNVFFISFISYLTCEYFLVFRLPFHSTYCVSDTRFFFFWQYQGLTWGLHFEPLRQPFLC